MGEIKYLISQKQITRYTVILKFIEGEITRLEAADRLGLSERQITRIKKGVIKKGAAFLQHKNTGRKPAHAIDNEMAEKIASLKHRIVQRRKFSPLPGTPGRTRGNNY